MNNIPSQKNLKIFGLIWSAILAILAYKLNDFRFLFAFLFLAFFLVSIFSPQLFYQTKIYQKWIIFGDFLGRINAFIISFTLFYVFFLTGSLILKLKKKDLLNKKFDKSLSTYFIERKDQPTEMRNQF